MNTNKFLDMYAKYIWPLARLVTRISPRCKRCILSEKCSPLKDGLCAECRAKAPAQPSEEPEASDELKQRFAQTIRSYVDDKTHHAVLLLSGGKDSAYMLHRMRSEFPELRILCVIVNTGFMSPTAISSAQFAAEKLKTDLLVCNACIDEFAAVLRKAFLDLDGRGSYGVIDFAEGSLIYQVGQKVAADMNIPFVLGGMTWVQLQRIVGKDDFEIVQQDEPNLVFPLAVWRPNEQEIRKTVRSLKLLPPGNDSPVVSNSSLILTMSAIDVMNNGYCSFEPEFAQLVREGKTDRKTWLHLLELLEFAVRKRFLEKQIKRTLAELDLSLSDVVKERK